MRLLGMLALRKVRLWFVYQAVVYGLGIIVAQGLVARGGSWYSENGHHRRQVARLFSGSLALSSDVSVLTHDLCWSQDGVQQVWGLGVPIWRMPFEALARIVGAGGFPDMLALALALALAAWVVLWVLFEVLSLEPLNRSAPSPQPSPPMGEREKTVGTSGSMGRRAADQEV